MPHDVTMPQLGMAQDAGKIVSWFKAAGASVAKGEALFEVETDKATMEVEAQTDGFLTGVVAAVGDDVPVGAVIAQISQASDTDAPAPPETAPPQIDKLPTGTSVTMPQLGMTQDTGLLVSWLKMPGDRVTKGEVLFEVETDKSSVEVEAEIDGFLAATLAQAGQDVPVGNAVGIISPDKPTAPIAREIAKNDNVAATVEPVAASKPKGTLPQKQPNALVPASNGRVLASPKVRRMALKEGLDLVQLAKAGHPQPFHVSDLVALRTLAADAPNAQQTAQHAQRFVAEIDGDGLPDLADWAAATHGLHDADALMAALAGASLPRDQIVPIAVVRHGTQRTYEVASGSGTALGKAAQSDAEPELILRDLRGTALRSVTAGADTIPVLTLTPHGKGLSIALECAPAQMDADAAIMLLSNFAGRMENPLRHLL